MSFGFGEDGAIGTATFGGMEITATIEAKGVSERHFVYGCICLAMELLTHYMRPEEASKVLQKYADHAAKSWRQA